MNCYFVGVNGKAMFGVRQVSVLDDVINDDDDDDDDDDTDRQTERQKDWHFISTRRFFKYKLLVSIKPFTQEKIKTW